jgi:cation diffusion facilitator CzcD-associated flavoprotein CzcO
LEDEELWEVTIKHLLPGMGDLGQKDRAKMLQEHGESSVYSCTEKIRTKVVVSCVGGLVEPKGWPEDIPGIKDFKGAMFHSARWDHTVDFNDKDVVVVGTGCSAAQFVPRLTTSPFNAKSVTQLMRSPPWVVNALRPPGGYEWWTKNSPGLMTYVPGLLKLIRLTIAARGEYDFRLFGGSQWHEQERKKVERKLLRSMKSIVPEKYHEILTPDYGVGCKRRIFDSVWFPALSNPKIELTTLPLTSVQERSVTLGPGRLYPDPKKPSNVPTEQRTLPADIIVLANGYDVQKWLHPLKVTGKQGTDLIDTMMERGGPQAYQGTAMDGFPNFFIIFGPNTVTGHSSVIMASENMANYAMRFIKPLLKGDVRTVEVKMEAEQEYTKDIQESLRNTVWMSGGCQSWYYTKDGWNSTVLPYVHLFFTILYCC